MPRNSPTSTLAQWTLGVLLVGACSDWSGLYGDDCNGEWVEEGSKCQSPPRCGDGREDPGEECDDGNTDDGDGCSASCVVQSAPVVGGESGGGGEPVEGPRCGDGNLDEGEICDDGNTENDDACLSGCSRATCGDGFVRTGVERCDDGNTLNGDGCSDACTPCAGIEGTFFNGNTAHCFGYHPEQLTQAEARAACAAEGSYLWTGTSRTEVGIAKRRIYDEEVWVGGQVSDGDIFWITGETLSSDLWVAGEPGAEPCVVAFGTESTDENFRTIACDERRAYVCEHQPPRVDPTTHQAYRRWFVETDQAGAADLCESEGGALVAFETPEERDFVDGYLNRDHWVNAVRGSDEVYRWQPGGEELTLEEMSEEADAQESHDCVLLSGGELFPAPCSEQKMVVCEFP